MNSTECLRDEIIKLVPDRKKREAEELLCLYENAAIARVSSSKTVHSDVECHEDEGKKKKGKEKGKKKKDAKKSPSSTSTNEKKKKHKSKDKHKDGDADSVKKEKKGKSKKKSNRDDVTSDHERDIAMCEEDIMAKAKVDAERCKELYKCKRKCEEEFRRKEHQPASCDIRPVTRFDCSQDKNVEDDRYCRPHSDDPCRAKPKYLTLDGSCLPPQTCCKGATHVRDPCVYFREVRKETCGETTKISCSLCGREGRPLNEGDRSCELPVKEPCQPPVTRPPQPGQCKLEKVCEEMTLIRDELVKLQVELQKLKNCFGESTSGCTSLTEKARERVLRLLCTFPDFKKLLDRLKACLSPRYSFCDSPADAEFRAKLRRDFELLVCELNHVKVELEKLKCEFKR